MTFQEQITKILKDNPGLQQHEIVRHCNRTRKTRSSVTSALHLMKSKGVVRQDGGLYYLSNLKCPVCKKWQHLDFTNLSKKDKQFVCDWKCPGRMKS